MKSWKSLNRADYRLRGVPSAACLLPAGRGGKTKGVRRRDLLGPARPELRRSTARLLDRGAGAGRPRRKSHGPDVHRRSQRRVALSCAAQSRLCESANVDRQGDGLQARRLRDHGDRSLRPARKRADNRARSPSAESGSMRRSRPLPAGCASMALGQIAWQATIREARQRLADRPCGRSLSTAPNSSWPAAAVCWPVITPASRTPSPAG